MRAEQRKITESDDVSTVMILPLSYEELTSALSNLKLKKSPGPDGITNEMIVNLGHDRRPNVNGAKESVLERNVV